MILVFGHKTPNRREVGELLYLGNDGDEAQKAIDENKDKFPRIDQSLHGIEGWFRTVQHYDENHPAVEQRDVASSSDEPASQSAPESSEEMTSEPKAKRSKK
jgi:hypothetical protein